MEKTTYKYFLLVPIIFLFGSITYRSHSILVLCVSMVLCLIAFLIIHEGFNERDSWPYYVLCCGALLSIILGFITAGYAESEMRLPISVGLISSGIGYFIVFFGK
jgi:uncharacterized membrane protein